MASKSDEGEPQAKRQKTSSNSAFHHAQPPQVLVVQPLMATGEGDQSPILVVAEQGQDGAQRPAQSSATSNGNADGANHDEDTDVVHQPSMNASDGDHGVGGGDGDVNNDVSATSGPTTSGGDGGAHNTTVVNVGVSLGISSNFVCDVCNRGFTQRSHLNRHMRIHTGHRPYVCEECKKSFTQSGHLAEHMKGHTNEQPFVCDIDGCGQSYRRKAHLIRHQLVHTGKKPFQCEHCSERFTRKEKMHRHIQVHHTHEKPFVCNECNKRFSRQWHLRRHIRTHTGEQPYACSHCSKSFTQSAHLRTHERTQHSMDGDVVGVGPTVATETMQPRAVEVVPEPLVVDDRGQPRGPRVVATELTL